MNEKVTLLEFSVKNRSDAKITIANGVITNCYYFDLDGKEERYSYRGKSDFYKIVELAMEAIVRNTDDFHKMYLSLNMDTVEFKIARRVIMQEVDKLKRLMDYII